jgi:hypothetical protein
MTRLPLANRIFVKLAALVFVVASTVISSRAQTQDFEIMVNGPWQFVVALDSAGKERLFVVAPYDDTHVAYLWSGSNASMRYWMDSMGNPVGKLDLRQNETDSTGKYQQNIYALDFSNYSPLTPPFPRRSPELVYQTTTRISQSTIQKVLFPAATDTSISRYAISLPVPDYVRTYSGRFGHGTAEAEIPTAIDGSAAPAAQTTWAVLHYGLTTATASSSVSLAGGENAGQISFGAPDIYGHYGVSLALIEAPLCKISTTTSPKYYGTDCMKYSELVSPPAWTDDMSCDSLSGLSFALSAKLWGLNEYALFPSEKNQAGDQDFGNYDYECGPYGGKNVSAARVQQTQVAEHNFAVAQLDTALSELETLPDSSSQRSSSKSVRRPNEKQIEGTSVQTDFTQIFTDLNLLFPSGVPTEAQNAYYCACEQAPLSADAKGSLCTKFRPSECTGTLQSNLKAIYDSMAPSDKGSSDCHAPQISISRAIQP